MQGIKDFLVLLFLAALAAGIARWRGAASNRAAFFRNLAAGMPIQGALDVHRGAFHGLWLTGAATVYMVMAGVVSFLSEPLTLDFDTNQLLLMAFLIGVVVFGAAFFVFKKLDRVPPTLQGSDRA